MPPIIPLAKQVILKDNLPTSIPHWYNSQVANAIIQLIALNLLTWLGIALNSGQWDNWQKELALPIINGLFIIFSQMWSPTVQGPFNFQNKSNIAPPK